MRSFALGLRKDRIKSMLSRRNSVELSELSLEVLLLSISFDEDDED